MDTSEELLEVDWQFPSAFSLKNGDGDVCGLSNFNPLVRIVGGQQAFKGNWPWLAALAYQRENGDTKYRCGGSLISNQVVLTAAHCVSDSAHNQDEYQLKGVLLGVADLRKATEEDFKLIKDVRVHNKYNGSTHENDIAILLLEKPVTFNNYVRSICLPPSKMALPATDTSFYPTPTYIAGWGSLHYHGNNPSHLQWVEMPLLDLSVCQNAYKTRNQTTDTRMVCAGYLDGSKDACQGDSGGPLVWRDGQTYYILGVVSYGFECARNGYPGVYVRVSSYIDWITNATNSHLF